MKAPDALILDRDGTLIEHIPYLSNPEHVRLLPMTVEALTLARSNRTKLFLHTNQSGVGRGHFGLDAVSACNTRMIELLGFGPDLFERICVAPEHPAEPSMYRKPSPAFAREVMSDYGLNARQICYIGDCGSDLATAAAAGTHGVGVCTGLHDLPTELRDLGLEKVFPVFDSLHAAICYLFGGK